MTRPPPLPKETGGEPGSPGKFAWRVWLLRFLGVLVVSGAVGLGVLAWQYQVHVVQEPGPHVARDAIQQVIAQESPVLYGDGETRIGVFFSQEHREYIPYERIPKAWVHAIVASEDGAYWEHRGIDPWGIARAMLKNVQAGRVVAGGSTLTQQTAKNLYYRPDRSFRSKWEELLNALRLEELYTKEEILEFYANQFHVSANGRGLGIAARYFFDKEVEHLSTLECAFLAGLVKAPAYYNPFVGLTEERRQEARERARTRTHYVLDRMRIEGYLDEATHARLVEQPIPFERGTFRYATSVLVDEVASRLEQAPFPQVFEDLGIDNPSTAGVQVVTTLDVHAQREATYGLWHHLTEVGSALEQVTVQDLLLPTDQAPRTLLAEPPVRHGFYVATVVERWSDELALRLDLGGADCRVDRSALERLAHVLAQAGSGNRWQKAKSDEVQALWNALVVGSVVRVSVRDPGFCDLELRPELQGAVLVLEEGQIRAMVGGNDNRNFNRATRARRQLGSTWKTLVFQAALQLGWVPSDALDNRTQVFTFEGTWYYPRPDHDNADSVSLAWAGTRSENVASIWLLYHLLDRLSVSQFEAVAELVGLTREDDEERMDFIRRIRDEYGIISTRERLEEAAFQAVKPEVLAQISSEDERQALLSMPWGRGAKAEEARVLATGGGQASERLVAVRRNFRRIESRAEICTAQASRLHALAQRAPRDLGGWNGRLQGRDPVVRQKSTPGLDVGSLDQLWLRPGAGSLGLGCGEGQEGWARLEQEMVDAVAGGTSLPLEDVDRMWIEGGLTLGTIRTVRRSLDRRRKVLEQADPYDQVVLNHHPDYRVLVGLEYLGWLAGELGVEGDVPPVLSLPLGA
ncbi:MAG: transglycosylase domain-containing protein, partial [Myxococcota bacterium]|nr:transglycosylase domain-containing protein [Myxococcota bacterium]